MSWQTTRRRRAGLGALVALALAPSALAGTSHPFSGSYTGSGTGSVSGTSASGSARASGHASIIGAGTVSGSAHGTFTSQTCVTFSGSAVLRGAEGSITLAARHAHACVSGAAASNASFSGTATVTGGTGAVAGARGSLAFRGSYVGETRAVKIAFKGSISY